MISIITITFNNYDELVKTLESIQGLSNIQSIVINGGSCEKTLGFLKNYKGIVLSEKDRGISDAFNKGISFATGEALMFLNSGDLLIDPSYITECNRKLAESPEIDYFYSDIIFKDELLGAVKINVGSKLKNLSKGMPYPHQSLIIRKRVFDKIGGFDENLKVAMDFDFIIRMFNTNFKNFKYLPIASVEMDGSGISSKQQLKSIEEVRIILKKYNLLTKPRKYRLILSEVLLKFKKIPFFLRLSKKYKHKVKI